MTDTTDDSDSSDSTTSLIIVVSIITAASAGILLWQYRHEISNWWHKLSNQTKSALAAKERTETTRQHLSADQPTTSADEWMDKLTNDD